MIERFKSAAGSLANRVAYKAQEKLKFFQTFGSIWSDVVWPRITFWRLVDEGYGAHAIVFACVQFYVRVLREPPLTVFQEDDVGELTPDSKHEARLLIRRPNDVMSQREFWVYFITYFLLGGIVCVWKERDRAGRVRGLWPLHRGQIAPIKSDKNFLLGWAFDPADGSSLKFIPPEDIIPYRFAIDPKNPLDGVSVLWPLARAIDLGAEAMRYVYAYLKNDASPRTALVAKALLPEPVKKAMLEQFREQYGGDNRGMPMILEGQEASLERIGAHLDELGSESLHSVPDAWITAAFGVPAVLIGTPGGLQRSIQGAPKEMKAHFVESVAVPIWADIGDAFSRHLLWPEFPGSEEKGLVMAFDLSKVRALQEDKIAKRRSILDGLRMRLHTVNEARAEDGKDPVDGGDVFLQPSGFTEIPAGGKRDEGFSVEVGKITATITALTAVYGKPPVESMRALAVNGMGYTVEAAKEIFPDLPEEPEPTPPGPMPPQFALPDGGGDEPPPAPDEPAGDQEPPEPLPPGAKALPLPAEVVIDEGDIEDAAREWDRWAERYSPDLVGIMSATVAKPKKTPRKGSTR